MKKAYYLVARVHHPDKKGNTKEATAYFQEIQHAYEVLSDKNERAWYDAHREEILRGGTGGGDNNADNLLILKDGINTSCSHASHDTDVV